MYPESAPDIELLRPQLEQQKVITCEPANKFITGYA
jgi:hypothetical protein